MNGSQKPPGEGQPLHPSQPTPPTQKLTPIQTQPMGKPMNTHLGCPHGLGALAHLDSLLIGQVVELLEAIVGFETNNRYKVMNSLGHQVFFISEETDCCQRQCCGPRRGFVMRVTDAKNQEVMRIIRPFKFFACSSWFAFPGTCCSLDLEVQAPVGELIGFVKQEVSFWKANLGLYNSDHEMVGLLIGPCCVCKGPCCGDIEFHVMDPSGTKEEIGSCTKKWSGFAKEMFTDSDNFSIQFPMDLDVRTKALFLGATMMLDFMFFEKPN